MEEGQKSATQRRRDVTATVLENRIRLFGIFTVLSLLGSGAACAAIGYILLWHSEHRFFLEQYESVTDQMFQTQLSGLNARISTGESFAALYGGFCPNEENWPNCWIPFSIWVENTSPLVDILKIRVTSLLPIVYPHQVSSFELFSKVCFAEGNFPPGTGNHSFGYGIYSLDKNGQSYHDTTGISPWSPYQLLTPSLEAPHSIASTMLYNVHSQQSRSVAMDQIIRCYETSSDCSSSMTGILQLIVDNTPRPSSIIFSPITPSSNQSKLVGFVSIVINWNTILTTSTSTRSPIIVIIDSGSPQATYELDNGKIRFLGFGDHHDSSLSEYKRAYDLTPTSTQGKFNYTVTFYPTRAYYEVYHTNNPVYVCLSAGLIILFTSLIFLIYDFFAKRESSEQTRILEAKQTYVRFISHVTFPSLSLPPPCSSLAASSPPSLHSLLILSPHPHRRSGRH
jgi:hypothetical protein